MTVCSKALQKSKNLFVFVLILSGSTAFADSAYRLRETQNINFEQQTTGKANSAQLTNLFGEDTQFFNGVYQGRTEIIDSRSRKGNVMKVVYPKGAAGPIRSGAQWKRSFNNLYDKAVLVYKVKPDKNFDFSGGGKLPGFCGGVCNSNGRSSDGYDGFSARMAWREDGQLCQHVYNSKKAGEDLPWKGRLRAGEWNTIKIEITMNMPGLSHGVLRGWLNGRLAFENNSISFREGYEIGIDSFYFSSFRESAKNSPPRRQSSMVFDEFQIKLYENVDLPRVAGN